MTVEILIIQRYLKGCLYEQSLAWPNDVWTHRSYARWACQELITRIQDNPKTPPIFIVEKFIEDMDKYSEIGNNPKKSIIFSIARDTAKDILELL